MSTGHFWDGRFKSRSRSSEAQPPLGGSDVSSSQECLHLPLQLRQPLLFLVREKVLALDDLAYLPQQFKVDRREDLDLMPRRELVVRVSLNPDVSLRELLSTQAHLLGLQRT
jgi:hypothetical protein